MATKCASIAIKPLVFIGGEGRPLDLILTNAPICYSFETRAPLICYEGTESDHLTITAWASNSAYRALQPPVVNRMVRSGRIANTVN